MRASLVFSKWSDLVQLDELDKFTESPKYEYYSFTQAQKAFYWLEWLKGRQTICVQSLVNSVNFFVNFILFN